jgi:hypothetical protein
MANDADPELHAAEARGRDIAAAEPRALTARYDRASGRVLVELDNDCTFAFPARRAQGLEHASDEDLANVELLGRGYGLHWESLDADLSIPGLLAGLFGTKAYMDRIRAARAGGRAGLGSARNLALNRGESALHKPRIT